MNFRETPLSKSVSTYILLTVSGAGAPFLDKKAPKLFPFTPLKVKNEEKSTIFYLFRHIILTILDPNIFGPKYSIFKDVFGVWFLPSPHDAFLYNADLVPYSCRA